MSHLFSIPVSLQPVSEYRCKGAWVIPPEAEEAMQRHHPDPSVTLEKVFRWRLTYDPVPHGWDWMLVVLPGLYPIGGYLAKARGGPKTNMILLDHRSVGSQDVEGEPMGSMEPVSFPRGCPRNPDVHVSMFWVLSKGLLSEMSREAGGWLADLAKRLTPVPETGCWIYLADAPPDSFVAAVRDRNADWYDAWKKRHHGPNWLIDPSQKNLLARQWAISCANYASGEQRIQLLRVHLRQCPEDARAWAALADTYDFVGRPRRAVVTARKAATLAPEWVYPKSLEVMVLIKIGRYAEAAARCRTILTESPCDLTVLINLAFCLSKLQEGEEQILVTNKLLAICPPMPSMWLELGLVHYRQGNRDEALRCFEQAVRLNPEYPLALNNYGFLLAEMGELDKALMLCRRACELEESANFLDSLGFVYMKMGNLEKARKLIKRAMEMDEHHVESRAHWAELEEMSQIKGG